ncbi:MAG TPA: hypothetical protein VK509_10450, partial [Polyangiales bacterium]|nr:hypothetical protein [Polyangiales bacterium]
QQPEHTFVVLKLDVDQDEPAALRAAKHYFFWEEGGENARTLGVPGITEADSRRYYDVASLLAKHMSDALKRVREPAQGADSPLATVYLAEVPPALEARRCEVERQLEQIGLQVVPRGRLPAKDDEIDAFVAALLPSCRLFVQLLGEQPEATGTRARLQLACAQRNAARGLQIVHWRDPALNPTQLADAEQRALLMRETVRAVTLPELCHAIKEAARAPAPAAPAKRPFVFVDVDRPYLAAVRDIFGRYPNVQWSWPNASLKQKELKLLCRTAHGVILFWGAGESGPLQLRYLQFLGHWKALKKREDRLRIYDGPPPDKPAFDGTNFPIIHGRSGAPAELEQFLRELEQDLG